MVQHDFLTPRKTFVAIDYSDTSSKRICHMLVGGGGGRFGPPLPDSLPPKN